MKNFKVLLAILVLGTAVYSCTDDDDTTPAQAQQPTPITPNEEELITTADLIFSNMGTVIDTVTFNDPDGEGGNAPTIDTIKLTKGLAYDVSVEFKDASDPADVEDITAEIKTEDDEHIICFEQSNISGMTIARTDSDGIYEVGLTSQWSLGATASSNQGVLKLSLRHQPGSKDGGCTAGDTDVEIDFPVLIQ